MGVIPPVVEGFHHVTLMLVEWEGDGYREPQSDVLLRVFEASNPSMSDSR
ncbi:hypothetical protein X748_24070 [Mesorhizobium sp. LNJC386A00]|nr:hypothetical protein X752_21060 [Mesorhizobium sp. LNJC398B00]ESY32056.1 hypothetical protein X748_24070 [Mesorhizobium sp. LNJC386A00]